MKRLDFQSLKERIGTVCQYWLEHQLTAKTKNNQGALVIFRFSPRLGNDYPAVDQPSTFTKHLALGRADNFVGGAQTNGTYFVELL